ncbi:hypothetical protein B0H11DRAFT_2280188 [Mycena galericulata]|nr:hypothetical protein B0H11DRAFT_2280188 [Mycena galericulata]
MATPSTLDSFLTSPVRRRSNSLTPGAPTGGPSGQDTANGLLQTPLGTTLPALDLTLVTRKRTAEDMAQYAETVARNVRLKPAAKAELMKFVAATPPQQGSWLAAHLLHLGEKLDALQPGETVYHIPEMLKGQLDKSAFLAIIDAAVPAYLEKDILVKRVQAHLEGHPSWGWTSEVQADKSKTRVLITRIRAKLTHSRNDMKSLLEKSLGTVDVDEDDEERTPDEERNLPPRPRTGHTDTYTLTRQIVGLGARVAPEVKVSLDLCVRVACLRANLPEAPGPTYWSELDKYIKKVRESKQGDPKRISDVFGSIYEADLVMFPGHTLSSAELDELNSTKSATIADAV